MSRIYLVKDLRRCHVKMSGYSTEKDVDQVFSVNVLSSRRCIVDCTALHSSENPSWRSDQTGSQHRLTSVQ